MSYHVYVLHSRTLGRFYTGFAGRMEKRLQQHRSSSGCWTRQAEDWELVHKEEVPSRSDARALEKKIKVRGAERSLSDCRVRSVRSA